MKTFYLIPLLFLSACSTTPQLILRPPPPPAAVDNSAVRYPEIVRAYHFGRYADPNDDLVMHGQHTVFRVEENTRWDLHPATIGNNDFFSTVPGSRDAAFSPAPVNEAILAEVNSQRLATAQIMVQTRTLSSALMQFQTALQQTGTNLQQTAALRATVSEMKRRLDALEAAQRRLPSISTTNEAPGSLSP
jgi:hypothetical protein